MRSCLFELNCSSSNRWEASLGTFITAFRVSADKPLMHYIDVIISRHPQNLTSSNMLWVTDNASRSNNGVFPFVKSHFVFCGWAKIEIGTHKIIIRKDKWQRGDDLKMWRVKGRRQRKEPVIHPLFSSPLHSKHCLICAVRAFEPRNDVQNANL